MQDMNSNPDSAEKQAALSPVLRAALALNALAATVGLAIKFGEAATTADPRFPTVFGRVTNELCYFTIQSNIVVVVVCAALALRSKHSQWLAGFPRLLALVCITVTGIVYYALLAADEHFEGIAKVGDVLAHLVSPVLYAGTWLLLGPRSYLRWRHLAQVFAAIMVWIALALVRGAIIDFYPYDFVDAAANGYVGVAGAIGGLMVAALAWGAVAVWFDGRYRDGRKRSVEAESAVVGEPRRAADPLAFTHRGDQGAVARRSPGTPTVG